MHMKFHWRSGYGFSYSICNSVVCTRHNHKGVMKDYKKTWCGNSIHTNTSLNLLAYGSAQKTWPHRDVVSSTLELRFDWLKVVGMVLRGLVPCLPPANAPPSPLVLIPDPAHYEALIGTTKDMIGKLLRAVRMSRTHSLPPTLPRRLPNGISTHPASHNRSQMISWNLMFNY